MSPPTVSARDETSLQAEVAGAWRNAAQAGLRYWGTLGRLAFESVAALVPLVAERRPVDANESVLTRDAGATRTILMEAEAGQSGTGIFVVENTTPRRLSIPVSVSSFHDRDGREVHPAVAVRPDVIVLDPGDQLVVQVATAIDETLEPDVRYHAEISVPGLSETRIPIVARRRATTTRRPKGQAKAKTRAS